MGRRKDDPRDQAAKGYPGRRKRKTKRELERAAAAPPRKSKQQRAIEAMERAAQRDARLFADASAQGDLQALPIFLTDARLAAAQQVWRDHAPRLDKLHLLSVLDRLAFAGYCLYAAEFVLANREIMDKGYTIMSTSTKGAPRPWTNPAAARRDHAFAQMLTLGEKFGFTPLDRHNLIAKHVMRDDDQTLFGRARIPTSPPQQVEQPVTPQPAADDADDGFGIGGLNQFDAPPPGKLQ